MANTWPVTIQVEKRLLRLLQLPVPLTTAVAERLRVSLDGPPNSGGSGALQVGINVSELSQRGVREYHGWSFIHYSIIGNKLYRRKFGTITDFHTLSDMTLLSVLHKQLATGISILTLDATSVDI
eukprot:Em0018g838a